MEVLVLLLCSVCLLPTGHSLKIESDAEMTTIESGLDVTIRCTLETDDMKQLGKLESLGLEKVYYETVSESVELWKGSDQKRLHLTKKTKIEPIITFPRSGDLKLGKKYSDRNLTWHVDPSIDSSPPINLTVVMREVSCTDGPAFVCVAKGREGTVDSTHYKLEVVAVPQKVYIEGGRKWSGSPRDNCEVYARPGDRLDLFCKADTITHPLKANTVTWYQEKNGDKEELVETNINSSNSTKDKCSGTLKSSIIYYHVPHDVTVTCDVHYKTPVEPGVGQKTAKIVICADSDGSILGTRTQTELIGVFIGIAAAIFLLFLLIIIIIICCCGYRVKAVKKNSMDLNGTKL